MFIYNTFALHLYFSGNNVEWFFIFFGMERSRKRLLRTSQHLKSRFQQGERKGEKQILLNIIFIGLISFDI